MDKNNAFTGSNVWREKAVFYDKKEHKLFAIREIDLVNRECRCSEYTNHYNSTFTLVNTMILSLEYIEKNCVKVQQCDTCKYLIRGRYGWIVKERVGEEL